MKFVKNYTSELKTEKGNMMLLWGDPISIINGPDSNGFYDVKARNRKGVIHKDELIDTNMLLEIYIIDVGQGDGVLIKTPNNKWHLMDAGVANISQMTKKGAVNFLHWKFIRELGMNSIDLENLIMSHPDYDHYGGMIDLLNGKLHDGRTFNCNIENFYHSGMMRFDKSPELGKSSKGKVANFPEGKHGISQNGTFINEILDNKQSFQNARKFNDGSFDQLTDLLKRKVQNIQRLSHLDEYLPGYKPGQNTFSIKVLGPILEEYKSGQLGLRKLGGESITRNGHSIVLRIDYDKSRTLLTGDLNEKSQKLLMSYIPEEEFAADVVKGCHHGSEDIHMMFIKAMKARATVISSGDNEDYSHPRPVVLGASAFYGREIKVYDTKKKEYSTTPPLIYSTELARSTKLAYMKIGKWKDNKSGKERYIHQDDTKIKTQESKAKYRSMERMPLASGLVYGLVNIRTDGNHILCATMEESGHDFDVKIFKAGV